MSTRKSTVTSPPAQGTKLENASTSLSNLHNTKSLDKTNTCSTTADKSEMVPHASTNTIIVNTNESKSEQIHKTNQDTKPFQQRVTRNSPLLLVSPVPSITIKKELIDSNDHHTNSESEEPTASTSSIAVKKVNVRGRKSIKEHKELAEKDKEDNINKVEEQDNKEKEKKDEQVELKEKELNLNQSTTSASNRLTRKSVANQEVNTRVTRQRQSSGASTRSETPPARARSNRSLGRAKMPVPMNDPIPALTKRKRSVDADGVSAIKIDEPSSKYIKIEVKDPDIENDDVLLSSQNTNISSESNEILPKIKQELLDESDDEMASSIDNAAVTTSTATAVGRGRGRLPTKKTTTINNNSPSTRATRQTKQNSPVQITLSASTDNKRRRMGSQTRSLLKSNVENNSKIQPTNVDDEESKDSMDSTNTDDIVLALIKSEKISMEMDDDNTNDAKDLLDATEKENKKTLPNLEEGSNLPPPLIVDTDGAPSMSVGIVEIVENVTSLTPVAASSSSMASGSEKAASLSPSELVSEGVSEISVKQFYKKPKFLENNLGIEEDPKLGNIVQKVAGLETVTTSSTTLDLVAIDTEKTETTMPTNKSNLNESLKEGSLHFEEIIDEKKITTHDDSNSISSGDNDAPLLIVEDDEIELEVDILDATIEETLATKAQLQKITTELDSAGTSQQNKKLTISEVDNVDIEKDQDQEDELTLEDSETISMDNNASINDEIPAEIEDTVTDFEGATDLTDVTTNSKPQIALKEYKTPVNNLQELLASSTEKEPSLNISHDVKPTAVAASTAEDEDNDVLAKIDAELKKLDERDKEKLGNHNNDNKPGKLLRPSSTEVTMTTNKSDLANEYMDCDVEVKISLEDTKTKTITKDNKIVIGGLNIKLHDEQPLMIAKNIKLTDTKPKMDDEENVHLSREIASLLKDEKSYIGKNFLKISRPETHPETINGKSTAISPSRSLSDKTGITITKDDDANSIKSGQSAISWITLDLENDDEETLRKKEQHLQNLGLVTHKAAEKRRLEVIQSSAANVEASKVATQQHHNNKRNGKNSSHAASTHHEYTGTLKTIIKINRHSTGGTASGSNGRKSQTNSACSTTKEQQQQQRRQSLKITFQKGRARAHGAGSNDRSQQDRESHGEDNYYTIQNETEGALQKFHSFPTTSTTSLTRLALTHTNNYNNKNNIVKNLNSTYARKSYNYRNHHQSASSTKTAHILKMDSSNSESHDHASGVSTKKDEKEEILIPEKASSFKFHPGRLCEDQCFYCSGKFGLYDTPCHVGQIKSIERQQKILANEEKLTVDNCLCDACFRHVDRRANVPSYKKRLNTSGHLESLTATSSKPLDGQQFDDQQNAEAEGNDTLTTTATSRKCLVPDCTHPATHSLRRKCIRKSVKKFLIKFEIPTTTPCVWLCQSHYDTVIQCSGCVLCKRRLGKNHMYHITSDTDRLEKSLCEMGIPVQLGIGTAVCKLCRYFANLLMKPPDSTKSQKAEFVKNYRKRLLQFHNIHDGSNEASDADEGDSNSASNPDTALCTKTDLEQEINSAPQHKDTKDNSTDTADKDNLSGEKSVSKAIDPDFDATGISEESSNSSSASNTAASSPKEMSKLKAILQRNASTDKQPSTDISNVLRANPNISMRELFPGEEDLGLQFKVPFGGSGSQRTPEGWTRVQTFLQYDEPTRRLWEELQKPYGNQSSFLRHLILLEKYFRNGELALSASASNNASVYTQTVRQRLTSYDKGHCGGLHMGTGTPKENVSSATNSKSSLAKTKEIDPKIPTFVINEDDDEEDSNDQNVRKVPVEKLPKTSSISSVQKDNNINHQSKQQSQRSRSLSVDKLTKQLSSNAVTITARPKDSSSASSSKRATPSPQKSLLKDNLLVGANISSGAANSVNLAAANAAAAVALAACTASGTLSGPSNSRSILKCNLLGINKSVEILPISSSTTGTVNKPSSNSNAPPPPPPPPPSSVPVPPVSETKQQKILDVANKLLGNQMETAAANQNKNQSSLLSSPPELVSLQRRSTGQVMPNATTSAQNSTTQQPSNIKRPQLLVKAGSSRPPPNVVILPDTLTPQERLQTKTWRPTLMPVEENHNLLNKNGPLYQTADGRRLPALVQVQSGGKPFLISIFDYNRMCILRREKLMRDQMLKATKKKLESKQQQQQQQPQSQQQVQVQQQQNLQNQQQHHQQQLLQKTNLQSASKNYQSSATAVNQQRQHQQHQQQQQQQQQNAEQQRMIQYQILEHQQAIIKAATAALNTPNTQHALRYQAIIPKTATSSITTIPPLQAPINTNANFAAPMMPLLANAITNAANTGGVTPASSSSSSHNNTSWLWNNFPDANQLLLNGSAPATSANVPKLPQLLTKSNPAITNTNTVKHQQQLQQQLHQQQQFLLSKIPKSLTVIPQHKLMNNSATGGASGNTSGNLMKE